jgi:hypothetical protein
VVIKAESLAVLNTLREHGFQEAFKNDRSAGNGAYVRKGSASTLRVVKKPKI